MVRRMAFAGASNLASAIYMIRDTNEGYADLLRLPRAMRSSTAPCKLPASSS